MQDKVDVPTAAAALAALLVAADGVIDKREKEVATVQGTRVFKGFSPLIFETLLDGVSDLPEAGEVALLLRDFVDEQGKKDIMEYLAAVATADDRVVEVERQKLQDVADSLGTDMPSLSVASVEG